jgi:hypothetical protein
MPKPPLRVDGNTAIASAFDRIFSDHLRHRHDLLEHLRGLADAFRLIRLGRERHARTQAHTHEQREYFGSHGSSVNDDGARSVHG